jgi:MFS family permease
MALASATMRLVEGFASRDFALVFVARALLFFAQYIASAYLLYALQDYVGVASLPGHGPQIAAGLVNTIRTTGSIAVVVVTGWLMQRTARGKAFLQVYAGLTVAALLVPTLSATWTAMLIFAVLSGAAYGIFASVDLAIITQVLPTRDSAGRDIGVLAVTGAAPQLIAPAIGGLLIHKLGYGPLFAFAALMTLAVGGVSVLTRSLD